MRNASVWVVQQAREYDVCAMPTFAHINTNTNFPSSGRVQRCVRAVCAFSWINDIIAVAAFFLRKM